MNDVLSEPEQHISPLGDALERLVYNKSNSARIRQVLTGNERSDTWDSDTVVVVWRQKTLVWRLGLTPPWVVEVVARAVGSSVRVGRVAEDGILTGAERRWDASRAFAVAQCHLLLLLGKLFVRLQG